MGSGMRGPTTNTLSHDPLYMHPKEVCPVGRTPKEGLIETDEWKDTCHADFFKGEIYDVDKETD